MLSSIRTFLFTFKKTLQEMQSHKSDYLEPVDPLHETFEREKRFAADAAHELRTPLAALKAHAQVALRATSAEERNEALRNVMLGVDRSTHVIQQLLILSQMVPEATQGELLAIHLDKLAAEVIADLAPTAIEKHTEIELIAPPEISSFQGFPMAITILIRNVVDNAIRYTPEGSSIQVIIRETATTIDLQVIDNGPGIPAELRKHVFERFFRVIGNKAPGSGLGLSIVEQIAELHGAKIVLDVPVSGKGLQVNVFFSK